MTIQESGQELMAQPLKQIRPILISSCGPQLSRSLNIDVWTIKLSCGGPCLQTTVSLLLLQGQADVLMVQSTEETYISTLCISCSHWAGRLQTNQTSSCSHWAVVWKQTKLPGEKKSSEFYIYIPWISCSHWAGRLQTNQTSRSAVLTGLFALKQIKLPAGVHIWEV
ncbi:uncharacterized protein LOC111716397 isoform X4 [Eurytemora carolleeae]|uniref:uncharacterized protein LOC111716397 isoform X4 n=2 Tax=Eurytemora carolleeae TaxID=1294199 RepID=UPI000C768B22|nr:uncharacterized protein LOC111716397 isoform X4 [Eurytemora carolleeae]|eukprot:XP_023347609.1 uncharacterized protein LOC111716397 isoform X4 [Eurytemora affinis]